MDNIISVVISTRKIDEKHIASVKNKFSSSGVEMLVYENNGEFSLPKLYNKGLDESTSDIVVFMHDDIDIETGDVAKKLINLFENNPDYGIIGLAGTDRLVSGTWWQIRESMYGQVKHEHEGKVHRNNYSDSFGNSLKEVACVDGLFFAVHKKRIKERFDEDFEGFHFYDLPFCLLNYKQGVKIGVTTRIMVIHKSIGITNKQWDKNKLFFEAKYGNTLPIIVV